MKEKGGRIVRCEEDCGCQEILLPGKPEYLKLFCPRRGIFIYMINLGQRALVPKGEPNGWKTTKTP